MAKIAFIGAGSLGFARSLIRDILTFPHLKDCTFALMDINKERLGFIDKAVRRLVDLNHGNNRVIATTNRKEALKGADAVVVTILAGEVDVWRHDIEIPAKYGVDFNVGDTRGVAGIFRALRTIPVMVDICRDMQKLCPNALLLNYTNPMAMLCRAMQKATPIQVTGLCHSVQATAGMLAKWINARPEQTEYLCAGINHMSWFLEFKKDGKDAYPLIRKAVEKPEIYRVERVRNEMFLQLGYYITESSGHNSEYNWWFRKRPDLVRQYCKRSKDSYWNPGEHAFILREYTRTAKTWKKWAKDWFKNPVDLKRGHEYAAPIVNAWMGAEPYRFNGNIPNTGLITNLPERCCVEVPVWVKDHRLYPVHVGALPDSVAPLNVLTVHLEEMAVEAALTGNPEMVYHACCYDPLSASKLSLAEIRKMVREMLFKNQKHLPQFKSVRL